MNILDHRILIPKSPDTVWAFISDLSHNPSWQTDCTAVSFVSPRHTGAGVRIRSTQPNGRDYLVEMTAWYEGLGYEYHLVDGAPFKEARGRVRLQEIPEGTIVQWTFTYDVGGFLSGVRNAVSLKRQLEGVMIDSLRKLWKVLQQTAEPHREAKSLMRDAPDYEARMQYKPRHPSAKVEANTSRPAERPGSEPTFMPPPASIMDEPSILEDDTRPRVPVAVPAEPLFAPEPVLPIVAGLPVTPAESDSLVETTAEPAFLAPETQVPPKVSVEEAVPALTETARLDSKPEPLPAQPESEAKRDVAEVPVALLLPKEELSRLDTREISVFDLFGVPKPSVTQTAARVIVPPEPVVPEVPPVVVEPEIVSIEVESAEELPTPIDIHTTITHEVPVVTELLPETLNMAAPVVLPDEAVAVLPVTDKSLRYNRIGLRLRLRRKQIRIRWPG
jgi:hypothetical protein